MSKIKNSKEVPRAKRENIVQLLQNKNLEIATGIIHHLYAKLHEINGAG